MESQNPNSTIPQTVNIPVNGDARSPKYGQENQDPILEVNEATNKVQTPDAIASDDNCSENTKSTNGLESNDDDRNPVANEGCSGLDKFVEVEDCIVEPKVGMVFRTSEDAYYYYNEYARKCGFRVRILRTNMRRANSKIVHRQLLVCSCEGSYKKVRTPKRRRESRRFECKAMFEIKLFEGNKYRLINFKSEHSHDLIPPQCSQYLRPQKKLQFPDVGNVSEMQSLGRSQPILYSYTCEEPGGVKVIAEGFFKRGNARFLVDYFNWKASKDKQFFHSFRINEDGEICGAFFCDAKSRRDYGLFGDAVCFDATTRTSNADMVCVLILGLNNQGQSILFGCGLLDGHLADAMVWLFTVLLQAMGGKKPISIFAEQSKEIFNAIAAVFPECDHGLWNICQSVSKHLGKGFHASKSFAVQLKACMYDAETIEEFEQSWSSLIEEFGLRGNEWLQELYDLRRKWAQVYSQVPFCAGMTTTQKSGCIQKFLKTHFSKGCIVVQEFVDQYSKALADQHEKELEAEYKSQQSLPNLISGWSVEREALEKYTKEMFYCFQEGLQQTIDLLLELENDDGNIRTYKATEMEGQRRIHTLTYNHSEQSVVCTCRRFEIIGILCSHALKLFRVLQYKGLPPQYYLKRWTRTITDEVVFDPYGDLIPNDSDSSFIARYNELSCISQRISAKASKSKNALSLAKSLLLELEATVEAHIVEERRLTTQKCSSDPHQSSMSKSKVPKKNSLQESGGKKDSLASSQVRSGGALNTHQPGQEVFGLLQNSDLRPKSWQWIYPRGVAPQGIIAQGNSLGSQSQTQRPFLSNDLVMSQQSSPLQIHTSQGVPRSTIFSSSSTQNIISRIS